MQTRRNIHRQHRQATLVEHAHRLGIRLTHRTSQPRAEQSIDHDASQWRAFAPGQHLHARPSRLGAGLLSIATQSSGITHRQHAHAPTGTLSQSRNQVAVTGIVTTPGQHGDFASLRPAPAQGAPGGMGGALHQRESGRTGCNQLRIQRTHLCGTVQAKRQRSGK